MTKLIPIFIGAIIFGAIAFSIYALLLRGINVEVRNQGPKDITNVLIEITGNRYNLGTLTPMTRKKIKVEPKGESGVAIFFEIGASEVCAVPSKGYFENGFMYHGTLTIELGSNSCEPQLWDDQIKFSLF